jgi:hypothetical protein
MRFKALRSIFAKPSPEPGLEKRLQTLEERWNTIEAEWTEWYEKFRLLHLRIAHRQKALEKAEAATVSVEPDNTNGAAESPDSQPPKYPGLTDEQRALQQKILRQRARL